ncbi:isoleucine--tRNA ligase [Candidatus Micrarchaeota archaeon CG08_land_8_20_14_0_20_49_17]|nr:MAG: isoleucine--tRNA ligase [Candidatus Micrarchaeota archaeon CG1_02_49_24]PIU10251.1 MAG: isoleucine--tRNA ligase [Candidatus Micrarchaeota archaeon CG08_land_8_20_14_0_20_49_17]PIZ96881.1 MAG: isoleucine--tRNA ligase [Candidatus Micrarchaeota archaeon CG_4_10_14_0_2_um_filter_49_7]HII53728.1 isoleucine--tRNA ligase [Candidatus Micrarchaeota archaeon]
MRQPEASGVRSPGSGTAHELQTDNDILKFWASSAIYEKLKEKTANGEYFYFCDGPPYATGSIHPGTAWNKCIKDVICRYKRANGFRVRSQPGFDTHGLPIEVKVEQKLGLTNKQDIEKIGIAKFIGECKSFADTYVKIMTKEFGRVGVWMDWESPYITYSDSYIERSWATIREADEKGLLFQGDYVLPYCTRCETTVANYELEYEDVNDPSVFVKFALSGKNNEYLVIWTTTPWTLPANMAVMVHPLYKYAKVKVGRETWIIANDRLEQLQELFGEESTVILGTVSGKELEGMKYEHPLADLIRKKAQRKVVLSDEFVTLEEGTGLVHCAPAHGQEDFIIGKRFGLELFSPIDKSGKYTGEVAYEGMAAFDANKKIIEDLEARGALVRKMTITHRYPNCWRCKTRLIYLKTIQWFIAISKIKQTMLNELEKIGWVPPYGKERFREFVNTAPDWCISRQRYWGIPLPIWVCGNAKCSQRKIIVSRKELGSGNSNVELHRPYIDKITFKCKCGGEMHRVPEVLDVWFDSGNAIWAALGGEKYSKADFITEGKDQVRGWFYSLLGTGCVLHNEAPYKSVLMHGFFVDENGEKMSKSKGNYVSLEEIMEKFDADTFRLWSLSSTVWDDLKFTWVGLKEAGNILATLKNIGVYLARFYKYAKVTDEEVNWLGKNVEDRYILSRHYSTVQKVTEYLDRYEVHRALNEIILFMVDDLSRFYIKLIKGRENEGSHKVLYHVSFEMLKLLSLFTPFSSERIYQSFFRKYEGAESIFLLDYPKFQYTLKDTRLENQYIIAKAVLSKILDARMAGGLNVRRPVGDCQIVTTSAEVAEAVREFSSVITRLTNVKTIAVAEAAPKGGSYIEQPGDRFTACLNRELSKELVEEGQLNELRRRIQSARKEMSLIESDRIAAYITGDNELEGIAKKYEAQLKAEINAAKLHVGVAAKAAAFTKEWEIDGKKVAICVEKEK